MSTRLPPPRPASLNVASFAQTAALIGELARANMLLALMDGRALTAAELARVAGITPQTASAHLARLAQAGLLAMQRQGRHRYHRLASPEVARMIESVMAVAAGPQPPGAAPPRLPVPGPRDAALRYARTCYDHLAGTLAVTLADRLVAGGHVVMQGESARLSEDGQGLLRRLGMDLEGGRMQRARRAGERAVCRPCLDWSERRAHLAGAVGALFCEHCLSQGWLQRQAGSRAVALTPRGKRALEEAFGLLP
ncbi:winged helix-turn-helix domain-containing protein [Orrella sp. JC864]|uniref:ArsR/SmtB family transcription factor n=1 Tax=Orrella sp. JC864 TaxID=3120298 RepID=UPI0012BD645C